MKMRTLVLAAAAAMVLSALPTAAAWAGFDSRAEPNTRYDTSLYMFQNANQAPVDKIYFDVRMDHNFGAVAATDINPNYATGSRVHPIAIAHANAILGYWRDCNSDGYIGDGATGNLLYLTAQLPAGGLALCPDGSAYNHDGIVDEFRAIGPNANNGNANLGGGAVTIDQVHWDPYDVADSEARVWGDWKLPMETQIPKQGILPLPRGTFEDVHGHTKYADDVTLGDLSTTYDQLLGPGAWKSRPNAPSPLGIVRERYNDSDTSSGRGTPLVTVWNCDAPGAGPGGLTPGIDPRPNTDGSLVGTVDTLGDLDGSDPPSTLANCAGGTSSPDETQLLMYDRDITYANLELPRQDSSVGAAKTSHDFSFFFVTDGRLNGLPAGNEMGDPTGECNFPTGVSCLVGGGFWSGQETWTGRPPRAGFGELQRIYMTMYAKTSVATDAETPSGVDAHVYGGEVCRPGIDALALNWNCDVDAWQSQVADGAVVIGETYSVRDTDCYDNEIGTTKLYARDPRDPSLGARSDNLPCV